MDSKRRQHLAAGGPSFAGGGRHFGDLNIVQMRSDNYLYI